MTDRIIRPKELAKTLGISIPTLYRWSAAGELPPKVKLHKSGAVGWKESDIEAWLEERQEEAPQS